MWKDLILKCLTICKLKNTISWNLLD